MLTQGERVHAKNYWIEFCRFIAAFCIVWTHFGCAPIPCSNGEWAIIYSGSLFVEYFFLLTGYFSIAHIEGRRASNNHFPGFSIVRYIVHKFASLFPYVFLSNVLVYLHFVIKNIHSLPLKQLFNFPFECLLLYSTGIIPEPLDDVWWYLSAMFTVLPVLLYLITKVSRDAACYVTFATSLLLYGYILNRLDTLIIIKEHYALLRAFAGMSLGATLYYLTIYIKVFRYKAAGKVFITFGELFFFGIALAFTFVKYLKRTPYDICFVLFIFLSLLCTFSQNSFLQNSFIKVLFSRLSLFLGKLSLPIYCFHVPVIRWVRFLAPNAGKGYQMLFIMIFTLFLSIISLMFVQKIFPLLFKKFFHYLTVPSSV